jgi:hypothetical protein
MRTTASEPSTPHIQIISHLFKIRAYIVHIFKMVPLFEICDGYAAMLYSEPFSHVCSEYNGFANWSLSKKIQLS